MKQNLFDQGAELSVCKISTPNFEFLPETLLEIEIKWNYDEFYSEALISINDKSDFLNSFKDFKPEGNKITFYIEDKRTNPETKKNGLFQKDYIITQISEVKDDESNNKSYKLKCIDPISYLLKNTYFSKGYKNITISEIISDIFSIYKIKDLLDKDAKIELAKSGETPKNLVIPAHMSLYDFLTFQCNQEGYVFWQDKSGIFGKSITDFYVKNLNEIDDKKIFKQDVDDPLYEFKINEVVSEFNSTFDNLELPRTITYVYDPSNKKILDKQQNFNELYENLNFNNSKETYIQNTSGSYYDIAEVNLSDSYLIKNTYFKYLKNNTADLILTGSLFGNKLLELRDAMLIGSTTVTDGITKGNETLNGKYLVLSISDKILNNKYIQNIILGRINNTDKKDIKG